MGEEFETEIEQRKEEKFTEMKQQKATGGTTLSDFTEEDGS
jgi:hypothetical protein